MKTSEVDFRFPVLGFTPDLEIWGFPDLDRLTKCGPQTLRDDMQSGLELVDADDRRWRVRSVERIGHASSWPARLLFFVFGPPQSRIEHELEGLPPISLQEVQQRVCAAMEAHAENYYDGDDREVLFEPLLLEVKRTAGVAEIYDLLQPDTFEPY
jgi:hypothetical protein